MRRRNARARAVAVTAMTALVIVAAGCGRDEPPPEPDPQPRYEQVARDLCDRVRVEAVAERFDLSMVPWYERTSDYRAEPDFWYERCGFSAMAEDGRFATELEDFQPSGRVSVEVHHELAGAEESYDQDARGDLQFRADREPGATTAEMSGWWDSGMSLEWVREVDPDQTVLDDFEISNLAVAHLVRHGNLVARADLQALSPAEETAEAFALLHELVQALLDEAVDHLTLSTE